jgi:hypothetical protein
MENLDFLPKTKEFLNETDNKNDRKILPVIEELLNYIQINCVDSYRKEKP